MSSSRPRPRDCNTCRHNIGGACNALHPDWGSSPSRDSGQPRRRIVIRATAHEDALEHVFRFYCQHGEQYEERTRISLGVETLRETIDADLRRTSKSFRESLRGMSDAEWKEKVEYPPVFCGPKHWITFRTRDGHLCVIDANYSARVDNSVFPNGKRP